MAALPNASVAEAERATLGAVLLAGDAAATTLDTLRAVIDPRHMAGERTRAVYSAMLALADRGDCIDPVTVAAEAGGEVTAADVSSLVDGLPRAANAARYATIVREAAQRRKVAKLAGKLRDAAQAGEDTAALVAEISDASAATAGASVVVRTLAEICEDPAVLRPPAIVVPRLAWGGRVTLLAAREKCGKSTMLTAAAAAVSRGGQWLGEQTTPEPRDVLWVGLDENIGDLASRMHEYGADAERIRVVDDLAPAADPIGAVAAIAEELQPAMVVVDTLAMLVARAAPESGSAAAWTPVMAAIARIARRTGSAVVLAHHARKSDGGYRDSTAIGAGVDAILEMAAGADDVVRKVKAQARWSVDNYSVRLVGNAFELDDGDGSLDTRILAYVATHPGCSQTQIEGGVQGRRGDIRAEVSRLLRDGAIENRSDGQAWQLHTAPRPDDGEEAGRGPGRGLFDDAETSGRGRGRGWARSGAVGEDEAAPRPTPPRGAAGARSSSSDADQWEDPGFGGDTGDQQGKDDDEPW